MKSQLPNSGKFLNSNKAMYLLLFVFVCLNIITKFYYLADEGVYGDEPVSIYYSQKSLVDLKEQFFHDQNPPLQMISLHFWMSAFGVSDFSAKSFSVILSVLCSIVLFFFSKRFLNKTATILVSILFLLSNVQLFYSHEARVYPLVQLLCVCSFYCYFELLNRPTKGKILALTLFNLLLLFSHYLSIFILLTQFLCVWMYFSKNRKAVIHYFVSGILVVVLFLPWAKVMISNLPKSGKFWLGSPSIGELKFHLFWLNGTEFLFYIFSAIILSSLVMVFLNKRFQFFVKEFDVKLYVVFLVWYVLPIFMEYFIAQYIPIFLLRYFLYSSLGLYLLVGYIIVNLNTSTIIRALIFLPLLWILVLAFDAKPQKEDDWRSLVSQVKSLQDKKTIIMVSASYKFQDFCFYYDPAAFKDYKNTHKRLAAENVFCLKEGPYGWDGVNMDNVDQVLFVQAHRQFEDPLELIKQSLLYKGYFVCNDYPIRNSTLTVFKRLGMECYPIKIITEQKPTKENFWTTQIVYREQNKDTAVIYKTDMEPQSDCPIPFGIFGGKAKSGSNSFVINEGNQFSIGITKKIEELKGNREINISANTNFDPDSKGRLVVSVERNGEIVFWNEASILELTKAAGKWCGLNFLTVLPEDMHRDDLLRIYFANPTQQSVYIDDFKVVLSKGVQQ